MSGISGKIILIVDDSPSIRREVKAILAKEGFSVREAGSEFGMFSCIDEYGVLADLILMDLSLSDANGFELVSKIRAFDKLKHVPVVMLTQHSDKQNVLQAKKMGIQGYIVKPINPAVLIERIKTVLNDSKNS